MLCCNDREKNCSRLKIKKTIHYVLTELCYYLQFVSSFNPTVDMNKFVPTLKDHFLNVINE